MYFARGQLGVFAVNQQTPVNFLYLEAKLECTRNALCDLLNISAELISQNIGTLEGYIRKTWGL